MKKLWTAVSILAAIGIAYVIFSSIFNESKEAEVVRVNGQAVTMSEFKLILDRHRSDVYRYFNDKYGVQDSEHFWSQSIDGEDPAEIVKKLALDELVSWKVQQGEARKYGLIQDSSYASFLNRLKAENKQRKEDQKNQKPIFGPVSFDEQTFYAFEKSNLISQLKKTIAQQIWKVNEDQLSGFYDQNKDELYRNEYTMKIRKAGISFLDSENLTNEKLKKESFQLLVQARQAVSNGASFNEAIEHIKSATELTVISEDQTFDESTVLQDARMYNQIWTAAKGLQPGQVSDPIEAFDGAYYLIELIDKKDNGYKDFQSIREQVEVAYIEQQYDEHLKKAIGQAKVKIDQRAWSAIQLR